MRNETVPPPHKGGGARNTSFIRTSPLFQWHRVTTSSTTATRRSNREVVPGLFLSGERSRIHANPKNCHDCSSPGTGHGPDGNGACTRLHRRAAERARRGRATGRRHRRAPILRLHEPAATCLGGCASWAASGPSRVDPDLIEWDYGRFEGVRTNDILKEQAGWEVAAISHATRCPVVEFIPERPRRGRVPATPGSSASFFRSDEGDQGHRGDLPRAPSAANRSMDVRVARTRGGEERSMTAMKRSGSRAWRWCLGNRPGAAHGVGLLPPGRRRTPPPPVVTVVEARRMTVPVMAEPIGTTRALQEVSIRARVRGFLKEIHFKEGGDVKAGQLLFVIDEEPFKAKLAEAQADAGAGRGRAEEGPRLQGAGSRRGPARRRPGELALAEVEEQREQMLCRRNASSVEDVQRKHGDAPEGRGAGRRRQGQPRAGEGRLRDEHPRRPGRRRRRRRPGSPTPRST